MWHRLSMSAEADPSFVRSTEELLQSTFRRIVIITGGAYLCWQLVAAVTWPDTIGWRGWSVTAVVALALALSLWLLPRQLLAAQALWQLGLAGSVVLGLYTYREPTIGFLYALLPLSAVVTVGWPAGVLAEALVIALVEWSSRAAAMPQLTTAHSLAIILSGAFVGLLGWAATRSFLTLTQWSLFSFEQAQRQMEEARDQRVELKQTQEDLIRANRELARLSDRLQAMYQVADEARRAKEEFVANVSHELRTPLNMIIGFSEMIPKLSQVYGTRLPPALLSDIAAIQRNSQHLARLVDDVLDLSQVEAGRMALSKEWASPVRIVNEAAQVVQALFQSKGLALEVEVPPDLPPLFCDSTRIRQVVINLLSNAGRFTEQGGVRVEVRHDGNAIVISVADTGPGISAKDQKKIFEPFEQLDGSIRREHGGSGLGLAISKRFVEMHGGRMWLESEVGSGTTFLFSLPLEPPAPDVRAGGDALRWVNPYQEYQPRARQSKAPVPKLLSRFVLVESGGSLRRLFSRYMDDVEIVSVGSVADANLELGRSPAQALVVNAPPFLDRPDSSSRLANLPYGTPAFACWVPGEDEAAKRLGVVRYLVKPLTSDLLLSTVEDLGEEVETVLLVDDEPEALRLLARMLASAQRRYRILQATNGQRALSLLRERQPDLILLDLIMPGMDGFQVLQDKSQDPAIRDVPVVVISSRDPSGDPLVGDTLTVTRGGGLSVRELLGCIRAFSEVLAPSPRLPGRGQPEMPAE